MKTDSTEHEKKLLVTAAQTAGDSDNAFWRAVDAELTRLEKDRGLVLEPRKIRETLPLR